jgi:hypothetical protein
MGGWGGWSWSKASPRQKVQDPIWNITKSNRTENMVQGVEHLARAWVQTLVLKKKEESRYPGLATVMPSQAALEFWRYQWNF